MSGSPQLKSGRSALVSSRDGRDSPTSGGASAATPPRVQQLVSNSPPTGSNTGAASPGSTPSSPSVSTRPTRSNTGTSSFFRKASLRGVLSMSGGPSGAAGAAGANGGGVGELDAMAQLPAADISTPELLIAALQQVRLNAENLIRLGALPTKLTLMWLAEFATRGGLLALLAYMKDYKRNTADHQLRVLILRQCALFLVEYLKREDDEPEGVLCLQLDCCDELWKVLDERPLLLRQFVTYLRSGANDSANGRAMVEFRCAVLSVLATLVRHVANAPAASAHKYQALLNAGVYPTMLWLRRRWRTNDALFGASLALEGALLDAHERLIALVTGTAPKQQQHHQPSSPQHREEQAPASAAAAGAAAAFQLPPVPALVVLDKALADASPSAAAAAAPSAEKSKKRQKTVRVQLSAVSHVAVVTVPWSSSGTVDALKRATIRAAAPLMRGCGAKVLAAASTSSVNSSTSESSDVDDTSDVEAERYALAKSASGATLADATKLSEVGIDSDTVLHLRRAPVTVRVWSVIQGAREKLELSYDSIELTTVEQVRAACAARVRSPLAEQCRMFAQSGAGGGAYELCESTRTLESLPFGAALQFKLPPRAIKIAFTDGTFVFVGVCEGMPLAQLLLALGKKRSIGTARLKDYGVQVDDESAPGGGYWLDDDDAAENAAFTPTKKGSVAYLFEHADEHLSVRFAPRAHTVLVQVQLGRDGTVPEEPARSIELFFDVPVSASIRTICETFGLAGVSPHELALVSKTKRRGRGLTVGGAAAAAASAAAASAAAAAAAAASSSSAAASSATEDDEASRQRGPELTPRGDANGSENAPLASWISLRNQGVDKGETLVLQRLTNTTAIDPNQIDIWSEEETADTVHYGEEVDRTLNKRPIIAATLNRLVSYLTSDSAHDIGFSNTFMISFRTIAPPELIVSKFVERFNVPPTLDENARFIVQMRVCIALKRLVEVYPECSPVPSLAPLETVRQFVSTTVAQTRQCERIAPILLRQIDTAVTRVNDLLALMKKVDDDEAAAAAAAAEGETKEARRRNMPSRLGMTVMTLAVEEIARGITVDDFALFEKIEPREYFDAAWTRKRRALAPNLRAFIDRFNMLSAWVSSAIVSTPQLRERVRVFERFVQLMTALLELQNFSALMAIISGLNNSSILRLKHTKAKLAKRSALQLAQYESLMNMEGAFQSYRRALKRCAPPLVPYVGVSLMDLTFIEEGNPDNVGPLINFAKRRLVVDVVQQLESFSSQPFDLTVSKEVLFFIRSVPTLSDKECYALSLEIEPRGSDGKDLQ